MSPALLLFFPAYSIMSNIQMELELEKARRGDGRNMTAEDLQREFEFRKKKMADISRVFVNIKNMLDRTDNGEIVMPVITQSGHDLKKSISDFEAALLSEACSAREDNNQPFITALKLEQTMQTVVDTKTTTEEKNKSVTEFQNYARNAKHSMASKCVLGAVVGAVATLAIVLGTLALAGALTAAGGPVGLMVGMAIAGAMIGALSGIRIGLFCSRGQNDTRGYDVSKNLKSLVTERSTLFQQSARNKAAVVDSDKECLVKPVLKYGN